MRHFEDGSFTLRRVETTDRDWHDTSDTEYESRLQAAANNFIAAASSLPRVSGCLPPCGFQVQGAVYNCVTCQYDSCEFPLDCPGKEITVQENNRTQMWCSVPFLLPADVEIVWRYAQDRTMLRERFDDVTVGVDPLYSIPSARPEQSGTYQCEVLSQEQSLVRLYFYLTVVPVAQTYHVHLQDLCAQALRPEPQFPPSFSFWLPRPALLITCLTATMLLIFLSLGAMCRLWYQIRTNVSNPA
ncbi:sperm acrosome membrane-associated protein 6 isoform X1 [Danio rerio]|uniref:Sperm acrosome membrane-associated protein 6 isoform X1 n=1 Tax=Danio rerio TaxID=7955 RepID=A0AC58HF52_DANRE